jgi:hypothetical protein
MEKFVRGIGKVIVIGFVRFPTKAVAYTELVLTPDDSAVKITPP